jgi:hypothetical protein
MQFLYPQLLPDGSNLWYASAVPTLASDNPAGFNTGDTLWLLGSANTSGILYRCTAGGAPGTWRAASSGETGSGSFTNFFTGQAQPANLSSTFVNATAGVSTDLWVASVLVPYACTLTGVQAALNANSGTDKVIVSLYNGVGVLLANSALAGATITPASMGYQKIPFVTAVAVAGPALHFIGVSTNGTTGQIGTQLSGVMPGGVITTQVFGTLVTPITVPTAFTANQAPVAATY